MLAVADSRSSRRRVSIGDMPKLISDAIKERARELLLDEQNSARDVAAILSAEGIDIGEHTVSGLRREMGASKGRGARAGIKRGPNAKHEKWSANRQHALDARAALPRGSYQDLANWMLKERGIEITRAGVHALLSRR